MNSREVVARLRLQPGDEVLLTITEPGKATVEVTSRSSAPADEEDEPVIESELPNRCGIMMVRSGQPCARVKDHNGVHMNAAQLARKQAYNATRARERYQGDPEYRETIKAQSRASHARKRGDSAIE